MSKRPDPAQFASYSYLLAVVSAGILTLALLLGWIPGDTTENISRVIVWIALPTSSIGAFLGYAANADFKAQSAPEEIAKKARTGLRINLLIVLVMLLMAGLQIGLSFMASPVR
jgi:hypothetical protein